MGIGPNAQGVDRPGLSSMGQANRGPPQGIESEGQPEGVDQANQIVKSLGCQSGPAHKLGRDLNWQEQQRGEPGPQGTLSGMDVSSQMGQQRQAVPAKHAVEGHPSQGHPEDVVAPPGAMAEETG